MSLTEQIPASDSRSARAAERRRRQQATAATRSVVPTLALWVVASFFAFPIIWFVLSSFKPGSELFSYPLSILPKQPTVSGYTAAWTRVDFGLYFMNTFLVASVTTVLTIAVSSITGYALAKYRAVWIRVVFVCILATTMLPTEVILPPSFIVIRDLGLYNSLPGIIVPSILTATGVFMFRQYFLTVPDELLEAARMDGAREFTIFTRIMLPLAKPIVMTLAIISFQWRWNDYIWPLIVLNDPSKYTLQVALRSLVGADNIDWSILLSASVISMVPLIAIFFVFQRYVLGVNLNSGLKD